MKEAGDSGGSFFGKWYRISEPGSNTDEVDLGDTYGWMGLVRRDLEWSRTGRSKVTRMLAKVTQKMYR